MKLYLAILLLTIVGTHAWNNGLARTPPMGWLSWLKFACTTDCSTYPKQCINEQLYKDMVDKLASDGYLALGYNTVNIDDCWMEKGGRDPTTKRLIPEKHRFPSGIKSLADYAHSKKVQLGIYEDIGKSTCAGYPGTFSFNGSVDYTEVDAMTFSDWGVDSLKLDGCNANHPYKDTYQAYSRALGKQKHKIVFGCSWPLFDQHHAGDEMYKILHEHCHLWRNYNDIEDSWRSVKGIIEFYRMNVHHFLKWHGPGSFFDPDMLIIGNDGLSYEQSKSQMAFWCLWSAPLLMSNDLRDIKPEFKAILQNKHLIAVNQDPLARHEQIKKYKLIIDTLIEGGGTAGEKVQKQIGGEKNQSNDFRQLWPLSPSKANADKQSKIRKRKTKDSDVSVGSTSTSTTKNTTQKSPKTTSSKTTSPKTTLAKTTFPETTSPVSSRLNAVGKVEKTSATVPNKPIAVKAPEAKELPPSNFVVLSNAVTVKSSGLGSGSATRRSMSYNPSQASDSTSSSPNKQE
ncbi:PREDICTED: alpha-N-acetylgalactosaminidase-like [Rhagoletis zephyria]|uniref:alpha-N-acetylgalactosaminidase-like n=1 Tax=Rhagoletis zephyria TaxID=28612 RepID=UPI000811A81F|nr:PREDICTED: alpha-N-acetylgalactosaminidase-like [Rhagoletis zephyria]